LRGSRLAHEPKIAARIQELRNEFSKNAALHIEYLQTLLLQIATANVLDFFKTENGKIIPKPVSEIDREHASALAAIKLNDSGTLGELKFHNKIDAINVLLKSMGVIVEKHDHTLRSDEAKYSDIELARWIAARLEDGASTAQELIPPRPRAARPDETRE
jgi:hypothetical protein